MFAGWCVPGFRTVLDEPLVIVLIPRVMRRTGKLYNLTLITAIMTIVAATMIIFWTDSTSTFHLWFDIVPQGFGMASVITTTLIVSPCERRGSCIPSDCGVQAMIASVAKEDMAVATGSKSAARSVPF